MGTQWSADSQQVTDKNALVAAALSAAFHEKVVTKQEYERRKDEPGYSKAESLDLRFYEKLCYESVKGQYGDVFGENGNSITITLKSLSGQRFKLSAGDKSYVEELKYLLEEQQGIPVDHSRIVFTFKGKQLQDGFRVSDYGVTDNSEISLMPYLKASAGRVFVLDPDLLSPEFDYDFTNKADDGTRYERGGRAYSRPYGWYRYALNVDGKYGDNVWLGGGGTRTESTAGEWPVSFHGTKKENLLGIAENGYLLSKSQREAYGRGIYSSPSIEVAEQYAEKFPHNSKTYKVVFQNRVKSDGLKVITKDKVCHDRQDDIMTDDYWMQTCEDYVRPYGICIKEC